jgi:hypothetical protein
VADDNVAAVSDAPAQGDGTQAEVELLPAEKQLRIIAAGLLPRLAQDRVAGTDICDCVETFAGSRQQ